MISIDLRLHGEGCWPDLVDLKDSGKLINLMGDAAPEIGLALLPDGTVQGNPTVTIRIPLPDGQVVLAETTFALLESAVRGMRGRLDYLSEQG